MAEACEALDTPVVSGNVSFYNESFGQAIYPTPMVGMLGIFDDVSVHIDGAFKDEGDVILVVGPDAAWMDGSEYQKVVYGVVAGRVPDVDLQLEVALQARIRAAIEARLLKSAHDCAEGGLAVALAECCVFSGSNGGAQFEDPEAPRPGRSGRWLGADVDLGPAVAVAGAAARPDLALFGEAPTRVVVSCAPEKLAELEAVLGDLPHRAVGRVTGTDLRCTMDAEELFAVPVSELHSAYESLPERLA
jgi:phosphoribosylformylglycinamidine (FGAM) synthase-like enzyme